MSATKIVTLKDGAFVLETFDFRSEFAFSDFAWWISEQLHLSPSGTAVQPFCFDWDGSAFEAAWTLEHGCHIKANCGLQDQLRKLQLALSE